MLTCFIILYPILERFFMISSVSFNGHYGYYGKRGPVLEDIYPEYKRNYKDNDVFYFEGKNGRKPVITGNIRALAIQEQYPKYRYMFSDNDLVQEDLRAGDIRREFEQEELNAETRRQGKLYYIV